MIQRMMARLSWAALSGVLAAASLAWTGAAQAQQQPAPPTPLKVIVFDGGWNLPFWAAQRQGFFARNKLDVQLTYTLNSVQLVTGLLEGKYDLAFAGIDNVIAYQEGQGEVPVKNPDMFAFLGGDNGLLSVVSAPSIKTAADLKGRSLSVDAMTTGFAFVLRDFVNRKGLADSDVNFVRAGGTAQRYNALIEGKNDATLLRTPFDLIAREKGFNILAAGKELGDFQGTVGVATRRWAGKNEDVLVRFIQAYRSGLDWIFDEHNRAVAQALLVANTRDMTPELAGPALKQLLGDGLQRDAAINAQGIANVMALRSRFGEPRKTLDDPKRYFDMSYHQKAAAP
jgi:ABC-type nitrate/sulfonate/bicarbonate transport system substrate-binding protein